MEEIQETINTDTIEELNDSETIVENVEVSDGN